MKPDLKESFRALTPALIGDLRAKARDHAPDAAAREAGYRIVNAAEESVVRIYDEIWWLGVNAIDLAAELDAIESPTMRVEINSPGGDVFDGITIYNALRNHPAYVTTRVDGLAGSISSVIAQAGDHRIMQPSAQMMIHNAWGLCVGDNEDHADMAAVLEQQDGIIAGIYASRSGKSEGVFRDLMNAETWLTAEAAVEHGLADEIVEPAAKKQPAARTFHDELAATTAAVKATICSAQRVDALRADAGKGLSVRNREGLDGLHDACDTLRGLLQATDTTDRWPDDEYAALRARVAALTGSAT